MTNYINTFGGKAKDNNQAVIKGVDWDTEYDNIATAIATKEDLVAAATNGNLIEFNGSSTPIDAGIASANLDGLGGVVETRLDGHDTDITTANSNITTLTPRAPSGSFPYFQRAGEFWIYEGDDASPATVFNVSAEAQDTWLKVGATGVTADVTWSALDTLGGKAPAAIIAQLYLGMDNGLTGQNGNVVVYCSDESGGATNAASQVMEISDQGTILQEYRVGKNVLIPCTYDSGTGDIYFYLYWDRHPFASSVSIQMYLRGCVDANS